LFVYLKYALSGSRNIRPTIRALVYIVTIFLNLNFSHYSGKMSDWDSVLTDTEYRSAPRSTTHSNHTPSPTQTIKKRTLLLISLGIYLLLLVINHNSFGHIPRYSSTPPPGVVNVASYESGAQINPIYTPDYQIPLISFTKIFSKTYYHPSVVLKQPIVPYHCWVVPKRRGKLGITLARPALLHSLGIEHYAEDLLESSSNAPTKFRAWAIVEASLPSKESTSSLFLGTFTFETSILQPIQNFTVSTIGQTAREVILEFVGNTKVSRRACLYGLRVYGWITDV
jgi:hypothetical protein